MTKKQAVVNLLVTCHRRCCICHRFCGFRMELHHVKQKADAGSDDIENLIPLCFDCHAEVNMYNVRHPRGRKYSEDELIGHKTQWVKLCQTSAEFLASIPVIPDIGPLQGLYNELRFNEIVADQREDCGIGASFEVSQFSRCTNEGIFWLLESEILSPIYEGYFRMKHANSLIESRQHAPDEHLYRVRTQEAAARVKIAAPFIKTAREKLDIYVSMNSEREDE